MDRSFRALCLPLLITTLGCSVEGEDRLARVVVLADTHVIGPQYTTPVENSPADNASILLTPERLESAREQIHAMRPRPDAVIVLGDVVHAAHHSADLDWYAENESAFSVTRDILDTFEMPVHVLMGNHDYELSCDGSGYDRALSEELFRRFFGVEPYYALEYGGVKLYMLNGQQGRTWDPSDPACDTDRASYGETQLAWLDDQLDDGLPSIVMSHYMGTLWDTAEVPGHGTHADLATVLDAHLNVEMYLAGHTHRWIDLSPLFFHEHYVLGATRYDDDNFWVLELGAPGDPIRIFDRDKAIWGNSCAQSFGYTPGPDLLADEPETGNCVTGFE